MKTAFSNHKEVCNVWAKQNQRFGRGGNIAFNGTTICSYGWWPMAKFITPDVVLFRDASYSVSTTRHQSFVSKAINHCKIVFHVISMDLEHEANVKHYLAKMRVYADRFWQCRDSGYRYHSAWAKIVVETKAYCDYFGCHDLIPALFGCELLGPKAKTKLLRCI